MTVAQWVIYDHPRDYPSHYVVRRWLVGREGVQPTPDIWLRPDLPGARAVVAACAPGAYRLEPTRGDDPVIMEVWV